MLNNFLRVSFLLNRSVGKKWYIFCTEDLSRCILCKHILKRALQLHSENFTPKSKAPVVFNRNLEDSVSINLTPK